MSVVLCSNETSLTRSLVHAKLVRLGFGVREEQIQTPAPHAAALLARAGLRPFLLVHPSVRPEFAALDTADPNCVLVGDAGDEFTFQNVNTAFNVLMKYLPSSFPPFLLRRTEVARHPRLFAMGLNRYYMTTTGLKIDVGAYAKVDTSHSHSEWSREGDGDWALEALEYAAECEAELIGKPSPAYFQAALDRLGLGKDEVVMVGDDIASDVGGAQAFGIPGVQVRTGKWRSSLVLAWRGGGWEEGDWRPEWASHETVRPDLFVDNLAQFVDILFSQQ